MSVSMKPGTTALTRMPLLESSAARALVKERMAPLEAAYAVCPMTPTRAETEAILIMVPRRAKSMGLLSVLDQRNRPFRLTLMTSIQSSSGVLRRI